MSTRQRQLALVTAVLAVVSATLMSACLVVLDVPTYRDPTDWDVVTDVHDAGRDGRADGSDVTIDERPLIDARGDDIALDADPDAVDVSSDAIDEGVDATVDAIADATVDAEPDVTIDVTNDLVSVDVPVMVDVACPPQCAHECCGGVCVNFATNEQNCGGCGITCSSTQYCADGHCTGSCGLGFALCSISANRCCTLVGVACLLGTCPASE